MSRLIIIVYKELISYSSERWVKIFIVNGYSKNIVEFVVIIIGCNEVFEKWIS